MIRRRFRILVFLASDEFPIFLNKFMPHISEFSLIPLQTETSRLPLESPKRSVFHCSPCFTLQNPCDNLPSFIFPNFEKKSGLKNPGEGSIYTTHQISVRTGELLPGSLNHYSCLLPFYQIISGQTWF